MKRVFLLFAIFLFFAAFETAECSVPEHCVDYYIDDTSGHVVIIEVPCHSR